jgi:hypothetical protein
MDAAIKAATKLAVAEATKGMHSQLAALRAAERAVRPWVGDIVVAMDSADAVYKFALEKNGVDLKGVHPSAYPTILTYLPKPGDAPARPRPTGMAQDATHESVLKRFPGLVGARVA